MSQAEIIEVKRNSIAEKAGLKAGDKVISINGAALRDILDYEINAASEKIRLEYLRDGRKCAAEIENPNYEGLGIRFGSSLFDGIKTCANRCVFCFIDQLPPNMRDTVYVKDDDYRLSFLYGNFITLTNLKDSDIDRIIADRISPIYVSVHTTNPELRSRMLGRKKADRSLEYLKAVSEAGIEMHVQMVICPGLNNGTELEKSINDLSQSYSNIASVGVVPVGLTRYRDRLFPLRSFTKKEIIELISQADKWHDRFLQEKGVAWVYIADEFYILGGRDLPPAEHYAGFPQIENGIGLSRLFIDEASKAFKKSRSVTNGPKVALLTAMLFENILARISKEASAATGLMLDIVAVKNLFFGGGVNVTGLLTGSDIIEGVGAWIKKHGKPDILVIPDVILNADGLTLDDYTPGAIGHRLGIEIKVAQSSGSGFAEAIMELASRY
ncbi:MAG: DUF512 domain-containing protein [Firmicutes bacterium]|nr:DUF512 domain-containing protein [Bacillota bacterium]